ncbi:MAG: chemotaxis protein CheW [Pseudobdellovibrionaceae bacterium]
MSQNSKPKGKKFMIFRLGNDRYAVSLSQVKEVIGLTKITNVPYAQKYFKGMINLRNRVISILDLRLKFSIVTEEHCESRSCVIISEINGVAIGSIVDDVIEVMNIESDQIETTICVSNSLSNQCVIGVVKSDSQDLIVLIDIEKILSTDEVGIISKHLTDIRAA